MQTKTLQLLQQQDATTQKRVYYQHCDRLMNVILPYFESVADAEEVLQDTFLTIFDKIETFNPQRGAFKSWTHRIAINKALMRVRKKKRIQFTDRDLKDVTTAEATSNGHLGKAEIERYLNTLPEKSAIVFRLKVIEELSHQEIAEVLEIKTDASRAIFSRVRKKLRTHFLNPKTTY
ncbi:MAG: RNA polymerase sigma factor [Saprospiraceae bacterium]|nr:RNA polymerase sigma factor [Saprospiraceae bacterium]